MHRIPKLFLNFGLLASVLTMISTGAFSTEIPEESPADAAKRHQKVEARRNGIDVICHRGASEHAFENTLEAYRATFELGADGNEIDIRRTKDGVLVVFHDDMLDRILEAYGDVGDMAWDDLQQIAFRNPGRFGSDCAIPTLVEVFQLHRQHGGLIHLDIKRPELDREISELLTKMDMWDHVAYCNHENGGVIVTDPRLKLRRYKAGLYADRSEVFPVAIAVALELPGEGLIVDDPRGAIVALGRKLGRLSKDPVRNLPPRNPVEHRPATEAELITILRDANDWNRVAMTMDEQAMSGHRIRERALAAERLLDFKPLTLEARFVLEERVRNRSLHKDWMFHGFDGAMALRTLILTNAPGAAELARETLWRNDPALEPVIDPRWNNPRSWTDFRVKMVIFPALKSCPSEATEKLCRDYLALSDNDAKEICPPSFEEAGRALLAISPRTATAVELMKHRLQAVRGRAILDCLAQLPASWALDALKSEAPHALKYRVDE